MKKIIMLVVMSLLVCASAQAEDRYHSRRWDYNDNNRHQVNDISYDISNDGTLSITPDRGRGEIEITADYDLYIDHKRIELDRAQRKLVRNYYRQSLDLIEQAEKVGLQGAKIGVQGAALGVQATSGVLRALFTDYDTDDLERDLEYQADLLEEKAGKLEDKADGIGELAGELEKLAEKMNDEIPAIRRVRWF